MLAKIQVVLACLAAGSFALRHHARQPVRVGYQGRSGYGPTAAGAPLRRYDGYASPPQPYSFGYDTVDEYGNQQFHSERGGADNAKIGSYGYRDINGLYRRVNYVADANGFRATVDTNEPGTASGASADAVFNAAPVVAPVPAGAAVYASRGVPVPYGARLPGPYNANRFGGYRGYWRYPYGPVPGAHGYIPYRRYGYAPNSPATAGGYSYGGQGFYNYGGGGYATGYAPLGYGAPVGYGAWPAGTYGYKRR